MLPEDKSLALLAKSVREAPKSDKLMQSMKQHKSILSMMLQPDSDNSEPDPVLEAIVQDFIKNGNVSKAREDLQKMDHLKDSPSKEVREQHAFLVLLLRPETADIHVVPLFKGVQRMYIFAAQCNIMLTEFFKLFIYLENANWHFLFH